MSCSDPTFNQTLCQNVTNAGNVQINDYFNFLTGKECSYVDEVWSILYGGEKSVCLENPIF